MEKYKRTILYRAEGILTKYKDDDSIYYKELKKSYREFREIDLPDKTTSDLYLEHINRLCDLIEQKRNSNIIIAGMIFMILVSLAITGYTLSKYKDVSVNMNDKLFSANKKIDLEIKYENIETFNANVLSTESDYMEVSPLTLRIKANSDANFKVHYDIFLEEDNDSLKPQELLPKSDLFYNIKSPNKDSGVKCLNDATVARKKILVYQGEMMTNKEEAVDLRMWIDNSKKDALNKKFRFKINVSCYSA